jgi:hypothetical protein
VGKRDLSIREAIEPILQDSLSIQYPLLEVGSIRMLVELARIGHHVSIMTPVGAHNEIRDGELIFRPLEDRRIPINRFGAHGPFRRHPAFRTGGLLRSRERAFSHDPAARNDRIRQSRRLALYAIN